MYKLPNKLLLLLILGTYIFLIFLVPLKLYKLGLIDIFGQIFPALDVVIIYYFSTYTNVRYWMLFIIGIILDHVYQLPVGLNSFTFITSNILLNYINRWFILKDEITNILIFCAYSLLLIGFRYIIFLAKNNYGFGVMLSSSLENSTLRSYYTKKFSARSSEYFFKRPIIEARWDSSRQDDRGNFYLSSSMVSAADNLNTLFLYNYVRGQLKDINGIGTGNIYVNLYSTLGGAALTTAPKTPITGGWVSTGVYTASVALSSTASTIYDVWSNGSGVQYHTGTISPKSFASSEYADTDRKIVTIKNLKDAYTPDEYPKLRLYVRSKNWSPTIYTKATADVEQEYIKNLYYRVYRVQDGLDVIANAATASTNHTKVSYDISGSYFPLDMSLFEPGYMYAIKFIIKEENNYLRELSEVFKFRVDQ